MHTGSSKPRGPKLPRRGPPGGPCPGDQRLQPPLFSRLSALSLGLSRQYEQQRDPLTLKHWVAEDTSAEADSCDPLKLRATHAPCSIHCVVLPTSLLSPAAGPAVPCYSAASVLRRVRHEKAAPKAICASMTTARGAVRYRTSLSFRPVRQRGNNWRRSGDRLLLACVASVRMLVPLHLYLQ